MKALDCSLKIKENLGLLTRPQVGERVGQGQRGEGKGLWQRRR